MLNYELAKKLKDAGFPQSGENYDIDGDCREISETTGITDPEVLDKMRLPGPTYIAGTDIKISDNGIIPVHHCYIPTLSELIEACGEIALLPKIDGFPYMEKWMAVSEPGEDTYFQFSEYGMGNTPEIAVANLWLKLNSRI